MQDLHTLNELAAGEISMLEADGITPTAEEIVNLSGLGWAANQPHMRLSLSRGEPVFVGDVALWPMTIHAADWFARVGCHCLGGRFALAYAMAHSYSEGPELDCTCVAKAAVRVTVWGLRLKRRKQTLDEAILQVTQQDEEHEPPPDEDSEAGGGGCPIGDISLTLAAATGESPEFWERRCASSYAFQMLHTVAAQNNGSEQKLLSDPSIVAIRALGWAVEKIRRRHAEGIKDNG